MSISSEKVHKQKANNKEKNVEALGYQYKLFDPLPFEYLGVWSLMTDKQPAGAKFQTLNKASFT